MSKLLETARKLKGFNGLSDNQILMIDNQYVALKKAIASPQNPAGIEEAAHRLANQAIIATDYLKDDGVDALKAADIVSELMRKAEVTYRNDYQPPTSTRILLDRIRSDHNKGLTNN